MRFFFNFLLFFALSLLLTFCTSTVQEIGENKLLDPNSKKVVRIAEVTAPVTLFPHKLTNIVEGLIASQIHEGLVKIDPKDLKLLPGLAEKWEIDENSKTITFQLRRGVKFQNTGALSGKEVELTTDDIKFTFELLCTNRPNNYHFQTVCKDRLVGANQFYLNSKSGKPQELKGLKIIDKYTFSVELLNSPSIFLEILANPVAAIINEKSFVARGENLNAGLGPFILDQKTSSPTHIALYKNLNYHGKSKKGEALPYIDSLIIDIVSSSEEALEGFKSGKFDFITCVPSTQLKQLVQENIEQFKGKSAKFILDQRPEMFSSYYVFNVNKAPFNNPKLRQAFNYAIDRERIIEKVLFGQAHGPAVNGIVPPSFPYYKSSSIKGYSLNIQKAKELMAEAGYPNGKGLPEIQLLVNSGNTRNNTVAAEIQKQLKNNINVNVTFESLPNAEKFYLQVKGKGDMYRDGWVADYPSPESFLSVFYGEPVTADTSHMAYPNTIKYKNPEFDKYYKLGMNAVNRDTAAKYFLRAEQILINDAPLMPLWYDSNCQLISTRLKNFYSNALRYYDFTQVSIEEPKPQRD
jgi:oligopeptide transport system substrate-binding protein